MSTQSHPEHAAQRSPVETLTDMIMAYRLSQLIYVAARLGIADFLKDGPKSSEELAALVDVPPHAKLGMRGDIQKYPSCNILICTASRNVQNSATRIRERVPYTTA